MKTHTKLAKALDTALKVAREQVVRGRDLPTGVRTFLIQQGCLLEIMKGWYFLVPPHAPRGETALWHANFWAFLSLYLEDRVENDYCLSPEISLDLQSGETATPVQAAAILARGGNNTVSLRFAETNISCSLLTYTGKLPAQRSIYRGLNLMPVGYALARVSPTYFRSNRPQAEVLLRTTSAAELASGIIEADNEVGSMRILGGLETLGFKEKADQVRGLIALTGWKKATNPFPDGQPMLSSELIPKSPYADRIRLLWEQLRPMVLEHFPSSAGKGDAQTYLDKAHHLYQYDAYHSLSIEGFQVTPELVARIAAGNDEDDPSLKEESNRLAAKGYSMAHEAVLQSIGKIFQGEVPGKIVEKDLPYWYSALLKPFVQVGRLSPADVAGYREKPVYISGSRHVPPAPGRGVIDGMEAFHEALLSEPDASVRAILGHFLFVYIHPFSDGNGRIGRFLMNAMLASGGYPWTILRVTRRQTYMDALEEASVRRSIIPFTKFVAEEMAVDWSPELAEAERSKR